MSINFVETERKNVYDVRKRFFIFTRKRPKFGVRERSGGRKICISLLQKNFAKSSKLMKDFFLGKKMKFGEGNK